MEQTTHRQMSESFRLGAVLALTGGFLDAYTYLIRGGVFANAQTGNIVLLGVRLMEGDWGGRRPLSGTHSGLCRGGTGGRADPRTVPGGPGPPLAADHRGGGAAPAGGGWPSCPRRWTTRPMCWWPLSARSRWRASARSTATPLPPLCAPETCAAARSGCTYGGRPASGTTDTGGPVLRHYRVFHCRSGAGGLVQRPVGAEGGVGGLRAPFGGLFAYVSAQTPCENGQRGIK